VRDLVILENRSESPNSVGGDDHRIALATPQGIAIIDQANSNGDTNPGVLFLKSGNGVDTPTEKYVLHGATNDCTALGLRGDDLFIGTNGGGVTRVNVDPDGGDFSQLEFYDSTTSVALPSDNVTAVSCGKNALVATDMGVASIRFPEPGPCNTGRPGVCSAGREYLVGNSIQCVPTVEPGAEICNNLDDDCDGTNDEHPEIGSICDVQTPVFEPIADFTVNTTSCDGAVVALPVPKVSDNNDANPLVTNNAPARFPFGATTVIWTARDRDGNTSTETAVITVSYDGQPDLVLPADVTEEASSPNGTIVNLGTATGTICVPGGVTITHDAPARFPVGVTTVTYTARGTQGRTVTGTQTVTITDTTEPTIEVGPNLTFRNPGQVMLPTPSIADNATPSNLLVVTNNAPMTWPIQEWVTVTYTVRDQAGLTATDTLEVFIENETFLDPTITILTPDENATGTTGAR
jgi:hypothetical protein